MLIMILAWKNVLIKNHLNLLDGLSWELVIGHSLIGNFTINWVDWDVWIISASGFKQLCTVDQVQTIAKNGGILKKPILKPIISKLDKFIPTNLII